MKIEVYKVSVSLRSIIHSYQHVCFILSLRCIWFPSPYGVLFILIRIRGIVLGYDGSNIVSVSLRSIIHSYNTVRNSLKKLLNMRVSVSLRSIIHSYDILEKSKHKLKDRVSVSLRSIIHSYDG